MYWLNATIWNSWGYTTPQDWLVMNDIFDEYIFFFKNTRQGFSTFDIFAVGTRLCFISYTNALVCWLLVVLFYFRTAKSLWFLNITIHLLMWVRSKLFTGYLLLFADLSVFYCVFDTSEITLRFLNIVCNVWTALGFKTNCQVLTRVSFARHSSWES